MAFHPREGQYDWCSFFGQTYDEAYNKDQYKKKLAIENGYVFYELWSNDDLEERLDYLTNEILELYEENI